MAVAVVNGMEITKTELDRWLAEYARRGLNITSTAGILGQTYWLANGKRIARLSPGGIYYLDNPLA